MLKFRYVYLLPIMLVLGGCQSNLSGSTYSRDEARAVQQVKYGVVEDVRLVKIEGTKSPVGSISGAAVGGIAGSSIGGGKGQAIATVLGAVAGGLAGSAAEEAITRTQGVELVIRLEQSGELIAIVQEYNPAEVFHAGDRIRVMTVGGTTRVAQ